MWGDIFNSHHLKLLSRLLKRSDDSMMEIVTKDEDKIFVEYLKSDKLWKVEHVSSQGFVKMDFHSSLSKHLPSVSQVEHVVLRRRSIEVS